MAFEMKAGVLALQGDFREHAAMFALSGATPVEVRAPEQLETVDCLAIPGGESTTIAKLARRLLPTGPRLLLRDQLLQRARLTTHPRYVIVDHLLGNGRAEIILSAANGLKSQLRIVGLSVLREDLRSNAVLVGSHE